ncbi:MAG: ATP-dependent DNA helicase, partial [Acidilobaceae archaeon]
IDGARVVSYLRSYPGFHAHLIARELARSFNVCPFFSLVKTIEASRVVAATYPYLFEREIFEEIFYDYSYSDLVVVVDEAHNLLNAQSLVERRVSLSELEEAAREIEKYEPDFASLATPLYRVRDSLAQLAKRRVRGLKHLDKSLVAEAVNSYELLSDLEREIREKLLLKALLESRELSPVSLALSRVVKWLESLKNPDYFLFAALEGDSPQLVSTPIDPSVVAREPLDSSRASVLMSGTLPPPSVLRSILGLTKPLRYVDTEMLYGPLVPYSSIATIVATDVTTLYRERGARMYQKIASYLTVIARTLPGPKLVVYPSYDLMKSITSLLPLDLDMVVETAATSLSEVEERVRSTRDILINAVAGGKLVEGVEFTEEDGRNILHIVVLVGVPFPQTDDFTEMAIEALSRRFKSRGEARRSFYLSTAAIRAKQALGRALRAPEDRAIFILLDYRYLRRDLKSLLGIRYNDIVGDPEALEEALERARRILEI